LIDIDTQKENCHDEKINKVIEIVKKFSDRKVIIFCVYRETAKYVRECLKVYCNDRTVETTVDKDMLMIDDIIRRFAPVANSIDIDDEDDFNVKGDSIDILVATTAMSEGFNFQDASVLINFDLPWTVLVLAQRMGRILRPWNEPREIYIFNLVPSTMERDDISHALNWMERLHKRGKELMTLADIPVIVERESNEFEMVQLAQSMNKLGDVDLNLDEVLDFIEKADQLQTSSFIDDLAQLDDDLKREIKKLPAGIKSYKLSKSYQKCIYILFEFRDRAYPVIFDVKGTILNDSDDMDDIMQIIRSTSDETPQLSLIDPDSIDQWIEICRNSWAAKRRIVPNELRIICQMVLLDK